MTKPFMETKLYLEGLIVVLNALDKKDENENKMNIGLLTDVHNNIGNLITKLQKIETKEF